MQRVEIVILPQYTKEDILLQWNELYKGLKLVYPEPSSQLFLGTLDSIVKNHYEKQTLLLKQGK